MNEMLVQTKTRRLILAPVGNRALLGAVKPQKPVVVESSFDGLELRSETVTEVLRRFLAAPIRPGHFEK